MAKARRPKKLRGASRMKEQGYKLVNVWLDANEVAVIESAARKVNRKLATFIREAAFGSAGVVLDAERNNLGPNERMWEQMIQKNAKALAVG